jgi:Ca2+/H+ antiporter
VELIIFISALAKNEIRIVQASLLGSILANLLLILGTLPPIWCQPLQGLPSVSISNNNSFNLGMSMLLGGLRFREQVYNSTVTQMSACLLSLSVISLVLPVCYKQLLSIHVLTDQKTAFHASFRDNNLADQQSLKISRGTSIVSLRVIQDLSNMLTNIGPSACIRHLSLVPAEIPCLHV